MLNLEGTAFYKVLNVTEDVKLKAEYLSKANAAYYAYMGAKNTAKFAVDQAVLNLAKTKADIAANELKYNDLKSAKPGQSVESFLYNIDTAGALSETLAKIIEVPTKDLQKAELKLKAIIELGAANGFEGLAE